MKASIIIYYNNYLMSLIYSYNQCLYCNTIFNKFSNKMHNKFLDVYSVTLKKNFSLLCMNCINNYNLPLLLLY